MTDLNDYNAAMRTAGATEQIARRVLNNDRPRSKQAEVLSVDIVNRVARVIYIGEFDSVPIPFTSVIPKIGQRVIIDGHVDDRHITEVIGAPEGVGSDILLPAVGFGLSGATANEFLQGVVIHFLDASTGWPASILAAVPPVWTSYNVDLLWAHQGGGSVGQHFAVRVDLMEGVFGSPVASFTTGLDITNTAGDIDYRTTVLQDIDLSGSSRLQQFSVGRNGASGPDTASVRFYFAGLVLYSTT